MQAPGVWGHAGAGPGSSTWAAGIVGVPPEPPSRAIRARHRVCPGVFWKVPVAQGLRPKGARGTQRLKTAVLLLRGWVVRGISHKGSSGVGLAPHEKITQIQGAGVILLTIPRAPPARVCGWCCSRAAQRQQRTGAGPEGWLWPSSSSRPHMHMH